MERLVTSVITIFIVSALLAAIVRGFRNEPVEFDEGSGRVVLRYNRAWRRVTNGLWFLTPVPYGLLLFEPEGYGLFEASIFALFLVIGCALLSTEMRTTAWFDAEGLGIRSPWRGERELMWTDVQRVTFSKSMGWFALRGPHGVTVRIQMLLQGTDVFANTLESAVPGANTKRAVELWRKRMNQLEG